ncbi:MAG TPA: hypothetical protein VJI32_00415 [Candidatus Nanoarchaeia archaeon]|nr:hypothetical protein [Candidatus Nanoarchaeia archaeon]
MMSLVQSLQEGYVKKVPLDKIRAKSLLKSSEDALLAVKEISLKEHNYASILRELYESLHQYCEAIGYLKGYKFASHEVITSFLADILKENDLALHFDRYRKLRNGINYYGKSISKETVEKAQMEIPSFIQKLSKHVPNDNPEQKAVPDKTKETAQKKV